MTDARGGSGTPPGIGFRSFIFSEVTTRKRILQPDRPVPSGSWIDLARLAEVELTSEDPDHPIEAALDGTGGWRASGPGPQTLRFRFDAPTAITRVHLEFEGGQPERRQEYVLRVSDDGAAFRDVARQQWNFGASAPREIEDHHVAGMVLAIELEIVPDVSGGPVVASLAAIRVA